MADMTNAEKMELAERGARLLTAFNALPPDTSAETYLGMADQADAYIDEVNRWRLEATGPTETTAAAAERLNDLRHWVRRLAAVMKQVRDAEGS
jgi:hypothetical protein